MMKRCSKILAPVLASALLLASCGGKAEVLPQVSPQPRGSELCLAVATDLHFLSPLVIKEGEAFAQAYTGGDGKQLNYVPELVDALVDQLLEERPDAVLLTGDLTLNGEKVSHEDLAQRLTALRRAGVPVLVIPGNHDIGNSFASGFNVKKSYSVKTVTPDQFVEIYREFGYGQALSRDTESLSYVYPLSEDLWAVMLDTNQYDRDGGVGMPVTAGALRPGTLQWLEEQLRLARDQGVQVITATHHNLLDHSSRLTQGYTLDNAQEVLDLYEKYGVGVNFSGHIHIQDIAEKKLGQGSFYDIATSSYAVYTNQYGVVDYVPGERLSYRTQEADVEGWAAKTGSQDPNLLGFEDYSYGFFYESAYWRSYANLVMAQLDDGADLELMAQTMAILNPAYFSGRAGEIRDEVRASDHYAMWREYSGFAPIEYINSMLEPKEQDPRSITIPVGAG